MIAIGSLVFARRDPPSRVAQLGAVIAMRYCAQPGCGVLVGRGYCRAHARRENHDVRRWYRIARWGELRKLVLLDQVYTCAQCGQVSADLVVDHIIPHRGSEALFWKRSNLQALCLVCHAAKTKAGA